MVLLATLALPVGSQSSADLKIRFTNLPALMDRMVLLLSVVVVVVVVLLVVLVIVKSSIFIKLGRIQRVVVY